MHLRHPVRRIADISKKLTGSASAIGLDVDMV
jgi:hypothetical protein